MIYLFTIFMMGLIWCLLVGAVTAYNITVGALLGVLLLSIVQSQRGETNTFLKRSLAVGRFVLIFLKELWVASIDLAKIILSPNPKYHPHIVKYDLTVTSDLAIALLSATITLLPGTVALGVNEDKTVLYSHAMALKNPVDVREGIKRIETLILGFMN